MKKSQKITTAILIIIFTKPLFAATIYVDQTTGNDFNDGQSPATAVATITQASTLFAQGDSLDIGPGIYGFSSGESFPLGFTNLSDITGAGSDLTVLDGELISQVLSINNTINFNLSEIAVINGVNGVGAGISVSSSAQINLSSCRFENNQGSIGGGLYTVNSPAITISSCGFINNDASIGGAMQIQINSDIDVFMDVTQSTFNDNTGSTGTAIHFQENGAGTHTLNINQSHFSNNGTTGVVFQTNNGISTGQITNSIFSDHSGTAVSTNVSDVDIVNVTFVNNDKALNAGNETNVINSIFWDNNEEIKGTGGSVSFSIVQELDIDNHIDAGDNLDLNPMLDSNFRLMMNSPAIDMGSDQTAIDLGLIQDIDSEARIVDAFGFNRPEGVVDIGADEVPDLIFTDGFEL